MRRAQPLGAALSTGRRYGGQHDVTAFFGKGFGRGPRQCPWSAVIRTRLLADAESMELLG